MQVPIKEKWSLLAMLRFPAEDFCRASSLMGQIYAQVNNGAIPVSQSWSVIAGELGNLERLCEKLALHSTLAQIRRLKDIFVNGSDHVNYVHLARDVMEVQIRLTDELAARWVFLMSPDEARYFSDNQFKSTVADRFPDAVFDMDEAGKCYATERATACVFHLMRVTEFGLQAIGRALGVSDSRPNWEPIIAKIDSELKTPYDKRQFKGSVDLLANASTHLHAVKVAWRNRAMHVQTEHTMEEAQEIYGAHIARFAMCAIVRTPCTWQRRPAVRQPANLPISLPSETHAYWQWTTLPDCAAFAYMPTSAMYDAMKRGG
ncbi:MAG TPA: hypothetical protein VGY31_16435 [Terriglobia bacterium]|nr:hypothetical protein [Terriglobia bacterium]